MSVINGSNSRIVIFIRAVTVYMGHRSHSLLTPFFIIFRCRSGALLPYIIMALHYIILVLKIKVSWSYLRYNGFTFYNIGTWQPYKVVVWPILLCKSVAISEQDNQTLSWFPIQVFNGSVCRSFHHMCYIGTFPSIICWWCANPFIL